MFSMYEKISYLKGLADGMEFDSSTSEGKMLLAIIDVLYDMTDAIDDSFDYYEQLEDYVTFIDEDLADLEDEVYDYEYEDYSFLDEDMECSCCGEDCEEED